MAGILRDLKNDNLSVDIFVRFSGLFTFIYFFYFFIVLLSQQLSSRDQTQPDMNKLSLQDPDPKNTPPTVTNPATTSASNLISMETPGLKPLVVGPPTSLQETVGPPADPEETELVSLPTPVGGADARRAVTLQESVPKQESLRSIDSLPEAGDRSPDNLTSSSADSKAGFQGSLLPRDDSCPELLQLDSDKYDEATYEKVSALRGMGHIGLTSSMYAAGGNRVESRHADFPSLSSGLSNGLAQPPNHSSRDSSFGTHFMVGFYL